MRTCSQAASCAVRPATPGLLQIATKASKVVLASLLCSQPMYESATTGLHEATQGRAACRGGPSSDEASYRSWANAQSAPILRAWSW